MAEDFFHRCTWDVVSLTSLILERWLVRWLWFWRGGVSVGFSLFSWIFLYCLWMDLGGALSSMIRCCNNRTGARRCPFWLTCWFLVIDFDATQVCPLSPLSLEVYWRTKFICFVSGGVLLIHLFIPMSDFGAHSYYPHGSIWFGIIEQVISASKGNFHSAEVRATISRTTRFCQDRTWHDW